MRKILIAMQQWTLNQQGKCKVGCKWKQAKPMGPQRQVYRFIQFIHPAKHFSWVESFLDPTPCKFQVESQLSRGNGLTERVHWKHAKGYLMQAGFCIQRGYEWTNILQGPQWWAITKQYNHLPKMGCFL